MPAWLIVAAVLTRAAPLLLALAVHGNMQVSSEGDSYQYLELATSLAHSGTFARNGVPEILRTPLYPLVLVPGTWLGAPVLTAVILQIALGAVIAMLVYKTATVVTNSSRTATVAASIYLIEPGQPIHAIVVMADALLTLVVAALTWVAVQYRPAAPSAWQRLGVMAVLVAAAAYAKPPGYFLGPALAFALVIAWWSSGERRVLLSHAAGLVLLNAVLLAPWHVRNVAVAGYMGFSTQIERAAFLAAPAAVISSETGDTYAEVRSRLAVGSTPGPADVGADATRGYRRWGMRVLAGALPAYAWIHVKGSLLTLMSPAVYVWNYILKHPMAPTRVGHGFLTDGIGGALRAMHAAPLESTVLVTLFCLWPLGAVVCWGVALGRFPTDRRLWAISGLIVLWLLIVGGPNRESRHRSPVMPALSVLAAIGLTGLRRDDRVQAIMVEPSAPASRTRSS